MYVPASLQDICTQPQSLAHIAIHLNLLALHLELGAKNLVPEGARNAKAILVVEEVVLEVVLLELLPPQRKVLVVQEVVRHVVANVAEDAAAVGGGPHVPVPEKDAVRHLPEREGQRNEKSRGHDQAVFVHGEVVVDAVEGEVEGDANPVVGEVAEKG